MVGELFWVVLCDVCADSGKFDAFSGVPVEKVVGLVEATVALFRTAESVRDNGEARRVDVPDVIEMRVLCESVPWIGGDGSAIGAV